MRGRGVFPRHVGQRRDQPPLRHLLTDHRPTLALGGEYSAGDHCATSLRAVVDDVTGGVVAGAAHWLPEEKPGEVVERLTAFFTGSGALTSAT